MMYAAILLTIIVAIMCALWRLLPIRAWFVCAALVLAGGWWLSDFMAHEKRAAAYEAALAATISDAARLAVERNQLTKSIEQTRRRLRELSQPAPKTNVSDIPEGRI